MVKESFLFGCVVAASLWAQARADVPSNGDRPLIVFDTDIHGDYDDIGALATLHALADRGECEILATVSSTRGNASVAAIEIVNAHYGRPDIPVGAARGEGAVSGDTEAYRRLARDYAQWVRHGNADDAPDAVGVYRRVLAAAPDHSVTICTVGYLSNLRRLLESGADAASPLGGRELVARKVRVWCCQACKSPRGKAWNSCHDAASARVAINTWPTPVVFCDWDYGARVYAGRRLVEMPDGNGPVRDLFRWMLTPREKCRAPVVSGDAQDGHAAWDQVTVLAAVRGIEPMFSSERGRFAIVDDEGTDEWTEDAHGGHLRLADGWSKVEVGRVIDDLMCAKPRLSRR